MSIKNHKFRLVSLLKNMVITNQKKFSINNLSQGNLKPLLVFIHIPKTGGTSFYDYMNRELGKEHCFWYRKQKHGATKGVLKRQGINCCSNDLAIIGGHIFFKDELLTTLNRPKIFISIVRDPIAHTISHFHHIKNHSRHPMNLEMLDTLDETLAESSHFLNFYSDMYCNFLGGKKQAEKTIKVIENNPFIIGKIESIDIFMKKLNLILGFQPRFFPKLNANSAKHKQLSNASTELIKNARKNDYKLLEKIGNLYCNIEL